MANEIDFALANGFEFSSEEEWLEYCEMMQEMAKERK